MFHLSYTDDSSHLIGSWVIIYITIQDNLVLVIRRNAKVNIIDFESGTLTDLLMRKATQLLVAIRTSCPPFESRPSCGVLPAVLGIPPHGSEIDVGGGMDLLTFHQCRGSMLILNSTSRNFVPIDPCPLDQN